MDGASDPVPVTGHLALFGPGTAMRYELAGVGPDGGAWSVVGTERRRAGPWSAPYDLTALRVAVERREPPPGGALERLDGVVSIGPAGVARLVLPLRGQGFARGRRLAALARFTALLCRRAVLGTVPPRTTTAA